MATAIVQHFTGSAANTSQPAMGAGTRTSNTYWINWTFFLSCICISIPMVLSLYVILKYERPNNRRTRDEEENDDGVVVRYEDVWRPCLKGIHPVWLLCFRIFSLLLLLYIIILNAIVNGGKIFFNYTELTFTLLIVLFGLGSLLSLHGCYRYHNEVQATGPQDPRHLGQPAGFWAYAFQIIFQMVAGAVMLSNCIYWFILLPFVAGKHYNTFELLPIAMHSVNVVLLLCETALNSLRFPMFRIAYFFLWTSVFVNFQWILHASIRLRWPFPFLDLSSPLSPLWYLLLALLHAPCYGIFVLVIKLKKFLLLRIFSQDALNY